MRPADEAALARVMQVLERDRGLADSIAAELVARYPDEPRVHVACAAARSHLQDYAGALRHLDIAACSADSAVLRFNLGYCLRQLGDYPRALAHLQRGLRMPGADEPLRVLAASTHAVLGQHDAARRLLGAGADTPLSVFCAWLLGADAGATRAYFAGQPERIDRAVLFWMKHDSHVYGALDDKVALARLLEHRLPRYWPGAVEVPGAAATGTGDDWWIYKPAHLAGGQGMRLTRSPASLAQATPGIAQRYVHPPLLVEGRKFNLRLLLCVHSLTPLRLYLWQDGLVFVSPLAYAAPEEGPAGDAHVVNLLRANPGDIARPLGPLPGHVVSLRTLLASGAVPAPAIEDGIARLASALAGALVDSGFIDTARGVGAPGAFPPRFLGLDAGFDAALQPHLFEIERYPGLGGVSPQSAGINSRFRQQWLTFTLADAPDSDRHFLAVQPAPAA